MQRISLTIVKSIFNHNHFCVGRSGLQTELFIEREALVEIYFGVYSWTVKNETSYWILRCFDHQFKVEQ